MPAERVAMRHAREIIRLKFSASVPTRDIARRLGLAPSTIRESLKRFEGSVLAWPLPEGMSDSDLEASKIGVGNYKICGALDRQRSSGAARSAQSRRCLAIAARRLTAPFALPFRVAPHRGSGVTWNSRPACFCR